MPYKDKKVQLEYQRKWMQDRRAKFFSGKKCLKCSATENLELHHRDPSQKESHSIWSWSIAKRAIEIKKCDVLCHRCHKEEHRPLLIHGTLQMYKRGACRCDLCRGANAAHKRMERSKEKAMLSV